MSADRRDHRSWAVVYGAVAYSALLLTPFLAIIPPDPLLMVLGLPVLSLWTLVASEQLYGWKWAYRHKIVSGLLIGLEVASLFFASFGFLIGLRGHLGEDRTPMEACRMVLYFGLFGYALFFPIGAFFGYVGVTVSERVWLRTLSEPESAQHTK